MHISVVTTYSLVGLSVPQRPHYGTPPPKNGYITMCCLKKKKNRLHQPLLHPAQTCISFSQGVSHRPSYRFTPMQEFSIGLCPEAEWSLWATPVLLHQWLQTVQRTKTSYQQNISQHSVNSTSCTNQLEVNTWPNSLSHTHSIAVGDVLVSLYRLPATIKYKNNKEGGKNTNILGANGRATNNWSIWSCFTTKKKRDRQATKQVTNGGLSSTQLRKTLPNAWANENVPSSCNYHTWSQRTLLLMLSVIYTLPL